MSIKIENTKSPVLSIEEQRIIDARRVLSALPNDEFTLLHKQTQAGVAEKALSTLYAAQIHSDPIERARLEQRAELFMMFHDHVLGNLQGLIELQAHRDKVRRDVR